MRLGVGSITRGSRDGLRIWAMLAASVRRTSSGETSLPKRVRRKFAPSPWRP